jgi:hypothetical protein
MYEHVAIVLLGQQGVGSVSVVCVVETRGAIRRAAVVLARHTTNAQHNKCNPRAQVENGQSDACFTMRLSEQSMVLLVRGGHSSGSTHDTCRTQQRGAPDALDSLCRCAQSEAPEGAPVQRVVTATRRIPRRRWPHPLCPNVGVVAV